MAKYFIGDLQGCFVEFEQMLDLIDFSPSRDQLYLVGDLVARGGDSLATVNKIIELGDSVKTVLGNHDLHLLAVHAGFRQAKRADKLLSLLSSQVIDGYVEWLRHQPLVIHFANVVMVHAGWYPGWSLKQLMKHSARASKKLASDDYLDWLQIMYGNFPDTWSKQHDKADKFRFTINACTRMRYLTTDLALEFDAKMPIADAPKTLSPWFNQQTKEMKRYKIIFGHWASLLGKTGQDNLHALDTGCVWGNSMTCLRLDDNAKFSVNAV